MRLVDTDGLAPAREALRIPRVIHRVWLGPEPPPPMADALAETWAHHHPGWELRTWRDADLPVLRHPLRLGPDAGRGERAAVVRAELLLRYGGVHLAGDFECLRSLEPLLDDVEAFTASEDGSVLSIGVLGAVPGHPLVAALLHALPGALAAHRRGAEVQPTVPGLMSAAAAGDPALEAGLRDFGPELFFPYPPDQPHRRHERFGEAYAARHWAPSWLDEPVAELPPRWRLVVAADWEAPGEARTLVRTFAQTFGPQDPVELVLVVPREPTPEDDRLARELRTTLGIGVGDCPPFGLESFAEASRIPYDVAVVPEADERARQAELAIAMGWMAATRALIDRHGRPAIAAAYGHATLAGRLPELRRRLEAAGSRA